MSKSISFKQLFDVFCLLKSTKETEATFFEIIFNNVLSDEYNDNPFIGDINIPQYISGKRPIPKKKAIDIFNNADRSKFIKFINSQFNAINENPQDEFIKKLGNYCEISDDWDNIGEACYDLLMEHMKQFAKITPSITIEELQKENEQLEEKNEQLRAQIETLERQIETLNSESNDLKQMAMPNRQPITGATIKELMLALFTCQEGAFIYDTKKSKSKFEPILCKSSAEEDRWNFYFLSTRSDERTNVLHGLMYVFNSADNYAHLELVLDTKRGFSKSYSGILFGSESTNSFYAFFKSEVTNDMKIAEFGAIVFQNITFNQKNDCLLGLCVTSSSGVKRLPTAQRILFTRKPINDVKTLNKIAMSSLLMNSSEIIVNCNAIDDIISKIAEIGNDDLTEFTKNLFPDTRSIQMIVRFTDTELIEKAKKIEREKSKIVSDLVDLVEYELIPLLRESSYRSNFTHRFSKINSKASGTARNILWKTKNTDKSRIQE